MNDLGLDKPIDNATSEVKDVYSRQNKDKPPSGNNASDPSDTAQSNGSSKSQNDPSKPRTQRATEEEDESDPLAPARWWYASTAFPLIAGTFGPMANAFSICALVENWRVSIPPGGTEQHGIDLKDPKWLIAVNAVSLTSALTANLSLLLNMARRLPFKFAQPITIFGFWIASVLLIALISVASSSRFHASGVEDQALTQAFYYAIFAAGLYQIISCLMCVTVYGAYAGHYSKEFKLTVAQRTLMLQTISFLVYQLLGAFVYSRIEGWKFLDAVYWVDFTSLTIGIGADYVPRTHLGRSLLFPFAIGGVIILGLVIGSIRSLVLDRGKKKLDSRVIEKIRRRVVGRISASDGNDKTGPIPGLGKQLSLDLSLTPLEDEESELKRRKLEFEAMRKVQKMASSRRKYLNLVTSATAFAFLWFVGALVFHLSEHNQGWTYFQSLYFSYTTLLTIGYGDFQPISNSGKPFFVFWSLLAVPALTILISNMGDTVVHWVKEGTIWLGNITVLPSDDGSSWDGFKYGAYKVLQRKVKPDKKLDDEEHGDNGKHSERDGDAVRDDEKDDTNDSSDIPPLPPGRIRLSNLSDDDEDAERKEPRSRKPRNFNERMTAGFERNEVEEELEAKQRGDDVAVDQHHYRALLLSTIRRLYLDSNASRPKKYTFEEWAFFLKLLGDDTTDSKTHLNATKKKNKKQKRDLMRRPDVRKNDLGTNIDHNVSDGVCREKQDGVDAKGSSPRRGKNVQSKTLADGADDGIMHSAESKCSKMQAGTCGHSNVHASSQHHMGKHKHDDDRPDDIVTDSESDQATDDEDSSQQEKKDSWSWIGDRSPLMNKKDEPEWLLERMFEKLEKSLKEESSFEQKNQKKTRQEKAGTEKHTSSPNWT